MIRVTRYLHCVLFAKFDFITLPFQLNCVLFSARKCFTSSHAKDGFSFMCVISFVKVYFVIYKYDMKRLQVVCFWTCMLHNQCQTGDVHKETWIIHSAFGSDAYFCVLFIMLFSRRFIYLMMLINLLFNMHVLCCHLMRHKMFYKF